ncbi:hypothetical protein DL93DRAFT_1305398 [Clavulina sp. PMI_390]|nr:hypothetical protein DL93DRAFT_1305398 [Clavulina sp. PMI_390]
MPIRELVPPPEFVHPDPYPRLWDWDGLVKLVASGAVSKLIRNPAFRADYHAHNKILREKYGSVVDYLVKIRLKWDLTQPIDPSAKPYFTTDIPNDLVQVVFNDWPYSVPDGVSHYVVWSRLPLIRRELISAAAWEYICENGICDFTGSAMRFKFDGPIEGDLELAGKEMSEFVKIVFPESEWECAWFLNPLVCLLHLCSVIVFFPPTFLLRDA